jgi:hypothetical protein
LFLLLKISLESSTNFGFTLFHTNTVQSTHPAGLPENGIL